MKYVPLLLANLRRRTLRTILTIAGVAAALFLFASVRTVVTTIDAAGRAGSSSRLVVQNATGIVFLLPLSYASRLLTVPEVRAVTWAMWFGGRYGDSKRFFANLAIDPASYLAMYPEIELPPEQRNAFVRDRSAAIVGPSLMEAFGWRLGQNVTLQGTIFPGDWTFTIRGVYTTNAGSVSDDMMFFHHGLLDERLGRLGLAGWYVVSIADPAKAAMVGRDIDSRFRNSSSPTKTGSERQFVANFATMWGNVSLLMGTIGFAVVFAILLVAANAMMMSARERTGEVAVLKAIGFPDRTLCALILLEAGAIAMSGAAIGLGAARLLYRGANFSAGGFLPGFTVTPGTIAVGTGIAVLVMLASSVAPAVRAARLPVVQALRRVE